MYSAGGADARNRDIEIHGRVEDLYRQHGPAGNHIFDHRGHSCGIVLTYLARTPGPCISHRCQLLLIRMGC